MIIGLLTPASPLYSTREFDRRARNLLDVVPEQAPVGALEQEALMLSDLARESVSPLRRAERKLHVWSAFAIIPIFALANAGVSLSGVSTSDVFESKVALGVGAGLVIGKAVGVAGFAYVGELLGLGKRPQGVSWKDVVGIGLLAGIGFTVALFVVELAFANQDIADQAKLGIFVGSIVAGLLGWWLLARSHPKQAHGETLPAKPALGT